MADGPDRVGRQKMNSDVGDVPFISGVGLIRLMLQPLAPDSNFEPEVRYELYPSRARPLSGEDAEEVQSGSNGEVIGDVFITTADGLRLGGSGVAEFVFGSVEPGVPRTRVDMRPYAGLAAHVLWDFIRSQLTSHAGAAGFDPSDVPPETPRYVTHGVDCDGTHDHGSEMVDAGPEDVTPST